MSATEVRQDLANELSELDGITAHPYYVQSIDPGTVWIRLDRVAHPNRFGGIAHWNVVLVLPQDQADAEKYLDEVMPVVREVVRDHLVVTEVRPQRLDLRGAGGGYLPCVFINGHREEE